MELYARFANIRLGSVGRHSRSILKMVLCLLAARSEKCAFYGLSRLADDTKRNRERALKMYYSGR